MRWLPVLVLMVGCMSPVMHFGGGKSPKEAQHDTLREFLPAPLSMEGRAQGPVKDAKIRVYADDQYRAQNLTWQKGFDERLEYVNAVLGPKFGVRLVPQYREWDHHSPAATLAEDLAQLQQLDAGDDVLCVIGLTSSLSLVSATFEQIGYASVPGRHMMLRGYADVEERAAFGRAFPDLSADERDNALEARRQHKTAALFLHELAHNMGAEHEDTADTLMSAIYSEHAASFSADAEATIQRTLDQRLGRTSEAAPVTASAPARPKNHEKMQIIIMQIGIMVGGKVHEDGDMNMLFSAQAAMDSEVEIVITKEKTVPSSRVVDLIDRAKAMGLKHVSFQ